MNPIAKTHTVAADQAGRADLVVQAITGLPRRQIRGLFDHGCVTVNGLACGDTFRRVGQGDVIAVNHDPNRRYHEKVKPAEDKFFKIVFEDAYLIVVEKAAGILSVPAPGGGGGGPRDSLLERISLRLTKSHARNKAFACHRLDREVSGLLVFGKTKHIADLIREQFEERKPQRQYLALVAGRLKEQEGTFRSYLATADNLDRYSVQIDAEEAAADESKPHCVQRDPRGRRDGDDPRRNHSRPPGKRAADSKPQLAITHYKLVRALVGCTLVRVQLETGRRNQIRVHFAEAGHPVLGDSRYRPDLAQHPRWRGKRLALHATTLAFSHPITGNPLRFESPMPQEMARVVG